MSQEKPIPNLCPKVILEGTRMTHKTEIALALNEHPRFVGPRKYRYHSPIISAEWGGLQNRAWGQSLINFDKVHERRALETFDLWLRLIEQLPHLSWIVDRFHHSTMPCSAMWWNRSCAPPPISSTSVSCRERRSTVCTCTRSRFRPANVTAPH
jgi:hypothetical protein